MTKRESLLKEGVSRVREVITKAVYLARGTRLIAKADASGNVDPYWQRADGTEDNLTGELLFARATSSLTLTTSAQSIVGDGDSTKVRLLLPTIGDWLVDAVCDFHVTTANANHSCVGELFVDDSGSAESGAIVKEMQALDRATVMQHWKVTTTAVNTPVELKASKTNAGGVAAAQSTQTNLSATRGAGGGTSVTATDHGALTGRGDDDHTQYQKESEKDADSGYVGRDADGKADVKGVVIEDEDGTPVGDILLRVIDEVLRIRNSGDSAYKNVELAELIIGAPTAQGILLKAAAGILFVQKGDDSALGTISASAIAANSIDTQSGNDRLLLGTSTAKRLRIPVSINDPATVEDGDVWYDLVTAKFRAREDGASTDIIHAEYTDVDAIADVPFIGYIPFGSEPITGQSYAP